MREFSPLGLYVGQIMKALVAQGRATPSVQVIEGVLA